MNNKCFLIPFIKILLLSAFLQTNADAQGTDQEVFLQFRHQGVVNTYISAIFDQDQFYFSVPDLFNPLGIDLETDPARFILTGNYLGRGRYTIDLENRRARFLDTELSLTADDFILSEIGVYLSPEILYRLFELEFIVDFGNLAVSLESPDTMPIVQQRQRQQQRERMMRTQRELRREFYPLQYDRNQQVFNGGFIDYNFTGNYSQAGSNFVYSTAVGSELFGGDLQGSIFGSLSETATSLRSSGLRWRYGVRDNDWISTITAGQTTASGLLPVAYTGVRLTNEPIEPRFMFGEIPFTGTVDPNSEVELYRNNTLVDFTEADETGQYRFTVPLTYGTSNYNIRVFSPTGEMTQREARLQIPFNFLPPGEINYYLDAGRLDNPIAGSTDRGFMSKFNLNAGITDRITAIGGVEYFEDFHDGLPTFRGGISSRLFTNYLISLEAANDAFYRATGSVIYPSNASISLEYTNYIAQAGIYNPSRNRSTLRTNIFTPFEIGSFPLFFRWTYTNEKRTTGSVHRYRIDLNTRLARANIRLGYRDSQLGTLAFRSTAVARVNTSATYNFSRSREIPQLMRGVFLRAQTNYIPSISSIEDVELQISRNFSQRGRFQIAGGRNFIGGFNLLRFTLTFDFNAFRTNTTLRTSRNTTNVSQSVRGSVGYDSNHNQTLFTNRQQVGRSGVAVRLFVDNNNSGTFDEGDELIPDNAVRVDRAGGSRFSKNGVSYISQLQPYRQYNLAINKSAINNPLLVPQLEQFSIITDPNQYKLIQIPFYMSGIIDGRVNRVARDGSKSGLGGLRLYLQQVNVPTGSEPFSQEIRTFSDGSFYAYEIPPGDYTLEADPSQISFLDVVPDPEKLEFTLQALAEGDFIEGLEINLMPEGFIPPSDVPEPVIIAKVLDRDRYSFSNRGAEECMYSVQLGSFDSFTNAFDYADILEAIVDKEMNIVFNSRNNLYSVRTPATYNYRLVQDQIRHLKEDREHTVAVVNHCIDPAVSGSPENLHIQLGEFSNQQNAQDALQSTAALIGTHTFIHEDRNARIFRLLAGPFATQNQLMDMLQQLIIIDDIGDLLIRLGDEILTEDTEYEYGLSIAEFTSPDEAIEFVEEQEELIDIRLDIIQVDEDSYQVVTEERTDDWNKLMELSKALSRLSDLAPPIVQLFPASPSIPTESEEEVFEEEVTDVVTDPETQVELSPVREIPEITEIIEEEELLEPLEPISGAVPAVDQNDLLMNCSFPIQVGSYGGHNLAQQMADRITESLMVDIKLYYNDVTGLYALRTDPYGSLQESLEQLFVFRESDPLHNYAIVGQCSDQREFVESREIQFLIPLIRYNHEHQANAYSENVKDNYGFNTLIRTDDSGEYFSVFAGPYRNYQDAVQNQNEIQRTGLIINPVLIIDPLSRNRMRSQFEIYFGPYSTDEAIEITAREYPDRTGRSVTVRIDDLGTKHLFDEAVYGSWSGFLNEIRVIMENNGMDTVEILIFD